MNSLKTIKKDDFFRLNFILQDSSAATSEAYLSRIIEFIIADENSSMTIDDIRESILDRFTLNFTNEEIKSSINKSIKKSKMIIEINQNEYCISDKYYKNIKITSIEDELREYINIFVEKVENGGEIESIYNLITKYIYFCFNANVDILLSLINHNNHIDITYGFESTNFEKNIINDFISWENIGKNKLIYNLISYCYVYCTLTTKKNNLLSSRLFSNKEFYLDANIIFRLAGLNKEDRQKTITSFKNKCDELNINLYYTNETYDEIYRVIDNNIKWLNSITGSVQPPELRKYTYELRDIYKIYCRWCSLPGNRSGDFLTFKKYIIRNINDSLNSIKLKGIRTYDNNEKENYYIEALREYKSKAITYKYVTDESIKTDIKNMLYIDCLRNKSDTNSIFSTQHFLISADQALITFSKKYFSGVPIVVLPSTWLTIMLKFTGRTDDDYNAFCLFLNLRYAKQESNIDITNLLQELKLHTNDSEIKERIVEDIYNNSHEYSEDIEHNDYETVVNKSFEKLLNSKIKEKKDLYDKELINREIKLKEESDESIKLNKKLQNDSNASRMATIDFDRENFIFNIFLFFMLILVTFSVLFLIYTLFACLFNTLPIPKIINESIKTNDKYVQIVGIILTVLLTFDGYLLSKWHKVNSKEYKENRTLNIKMKYLKIFESDIMI